MNPSFRFPVLAPASRTIPTRSKASARVQVVDNRSCLSRPRILRLESMLEAQCYDQLVANTEVREIEAQPPSVTYRTGQGQAASHTFDFRVLMRDGSALAVAVRPLEKVLKRRFDRLLELIAAQMPQGFATKVLLFTDADVPRPTIIPHAPATRLIERAKELGAPEVPAFAQMMF